MTEYLRRKLRAVLMSHKKTYGTSDYIQDGLAIHLDGINNTGKGHDTNAAVWTDISGNGRDFTLKGCTWTDKALSFIVGDYALGKQFNPNEITIEVFAKITDPAKANKYICVVGNFEAGGAGFEYMDTQKQWEWGFHNGSNYRRNYITPPKGAFFTASALNAQEFRTYLNGALVAKSSGGKLKAPLNNTVWGLGVNPSGTDADPNTVINFSGCIYAVRFYDRALTEEEIAHNYSIDMARFSQEQEE